MNPVAHIKVNTERLDARAISSFLGKVEAALATNPSSIIIDLESVQYIDSLGLAALARVKRSAGGRKVALTGLSSFVASVVRAAHLADYFEIVSSVEAAREVLTV